MVLTLAHLSDIHLAPMPRIAVRHVNLKRGLGLLNWHRNRRAVHRIEVVEALLADLATQRPDHIAVTGDLVNLGLPDEHACALRWLEGLGTPDAVSVVPGNHDIYTSLHPDPGVERWQAYMASDAWGVRLIGAQPGFPYVRRFGPVALIGLNSAVPTPPFVAAGRLGASQLARLHHVLEATRATGLGRIILIHHPPLPGQAPRLRALADAAELQHLLAAHGADLILHGHNHRSMEARAHWQGGTAVALGVPSFSAGAVHGHEALARYNLIRFHPFEHGLKLELIGRGLQAQGGPVVEIERRWLNAAPSELVTLRRKN